MPRSSASVTLRRFGFAAFVLIGVVGWLWLRVGPETGEWNSLFKSTFGSTAYKAGVQVGEAYAAVAEKADTANTWDPEADLEIGSALQQNPTTFCEAEWVGQGLKMEITNTPENKADFLEGCVTAIRSE